MQQKKPFLAQVCIVCIQLTGLLPLTLRRHIGWFLGQLLAPFLRREVQIALAQTSFALPKNHQPLPSHIFSHLCLSVLEACNLKPILTRSQELITCPDLLKMKEALAEKKGVICLTAHFGCWDLLAAWAIQSGFPMRPIGRPARNKIAQAILQFWRERYGVYTVWRHTKGGVSEILSTLEKGEMIAALIDQDTRVKSIYSPFFSLDARTPSALIELGLRRNCPIMGACMRRTVDGRYEVSVTRFTGGLNEVLAQYHNFLEQQILKAPAQWVWFHKRWRSRPDGRILRGEEYIQFLDSTKKRGSF
jgi:KDO2-lipid IV(A) lauroyltransferase